MLTLLMLLILLYAFYRGYRRGLVMQVVHFSYKHIRAHETQYSISE